MAESNSLGCEKAPVFFTAFRNSSFEEEDLEIEGNVAGTPASSRTFLNHETVEPRTSQVRSRPGLYFFEQIMHQRQLESRGNYNIFSTSGGIKEKGILLVTLDWSRCLSPT